MARSIFLVSCALAFAAIVLVSCGDVEEDYSKSLPYIPPAPTKGTYSFFESFDDSWTNRWKVINTSKYTGQFVHAPPSLFSSSESDYGLVVPEKARHYAAVAKFEQPIVNKGKEFVVQYEVRLEQGLDCGGAYIKLLVADPPLDVDQFNDQTPYVIMFGPDRCGTTNKVHFIFRHQNPLTKVWEEKHLKSPMPIKNDKQTHLYTLQVHPDNSFDLYVDMERQLSGSLLLDFVPSVNPPKEIDDPTDKKPADWVDAAKIPDPEATKPEDWDEDAPRTIPDENDVKPDTWRDDAPASVPDPEASKPEDWDDELDGEWEAPTIPNPECDEFGCGEWVPRQIANPAYRGRWAAPLIDNPLYKGVWSPRQIPNPNYFEDKEPYNFAPIGGLAIELWTMNAGIVFDNIFIGHDLKAADEYARETFAKKFAAESKWAKDLEAQKAKTMGEFDNLWDELKAGYFDAVDLMWNWCIKNPAAAGVLSIVFVLGPLIVLLWPSPQIPAAPVVVSQQPATPSSEEVVSIDDSSSPSTAPANNKATKRNKAKASN